ncbi:MAG: hypothetical protein M3O46_08195 [Myxococcota bacterium]|nr:hypothetical protein [Myxococcota bacterium]
MTAAKIAISISTDVLELARKRVKAGRAKSLSAYISDAVEETLRRDQLTEVLDAMDEKHGPPGKAATAWAKRILTRSS